MSRKNSKHPGPDGICIIDKPIGWTSHDVVARVRQLLNTSKVGHAGTLDPGASGVLVLGVGKATRLLRFISELPKSYAGDVVFGASTSTLDNEGEVLETFDMKNLTLEETSKAASCFVGEINQIPPMVSAIKIEGRRLHELAREGKVVERAARPVSVYRFDVISVVSPEGPVMKIEVDCSSGTYVRTLADDLGRRLGGGAHLQNLRRTAIGNFTLDRAQALDSDTTQAPSVLASSMAVDHLSKVKVGQHVVSLIATGRSLAISGESVSFEGAGPWAVTDESGNLLAVYELANERAKPAVVLVQPEDL